VYDHKIEAINHFIKGYTYFLMEISKDEGSISAEQSLQPQSMQKKMIEGDL
jgi:hypothetical protein